MREKFVVRHRSAAAVVTLAAANGVSSLLLAATFVTVARRIDVGDFGIFGSVYALAVLATIASDLGTSTRFVLRSRGSATAHDEASTLLGARLLIHTGLAAPWMLYGFLERDWFLGLTASVLSLAVAVRMLQQALLQAQSRWLASGLLVLLERTVGLLTVVLIAGNGVRENILCLSVGVLLAAFLGVYFLRLPVRLKSPFTCYKASAALGVAAVSTNLVGLDVVCVRWISGGYAAGLYAFPARLVLPMALLGSAAGAVLLRQLVDVEPAQVPDIARRSAVRLALVLAPFALFAVMASKTAVRILGADYGAAEGAVRLACVTGVVVAISQPLLSALQVLSRTRRVAALAGGSSLWYLLLVGTGARLGGATGAASGALVAQAITHVLLRRELSLATRPTSTAGARP